MSKLHYLIPKIERLNSAVAACVGDLILDHFVYGEVSRISPEAPIPVVRITAQRSMLGGVGNAVRNLGALGCATRLFSVAGEDSSGSEVTALLAEVPNCRAEVSTEPDRQTSVKTRYLAHGQQLLRADLETTQPVDAPVFNRVLEAFKNAVNDCTVVILSDYAKGLLHGDRPSEFIRVARAAGKPIIVDPKGNDFSRYREATLIKPNLKELSDAAGLPVGTSEEQQAAGRKLLDHTGAECILVTRGPAGMLLLRRDQQPVEFPARAREVYEVSGAGDTVAAALAAALGSGMNVVDAVELANIAAGIVVGKVGTAVVDRSEIVQEIELRSATAVGDKVLPISEAIERVAMWKRMGLRVGFTAASFDGLSLEHLRSLEKMRAGCDRLIVALASDASIATSMAGPPIQDQNGRALMLAALVMVDGVVLYDDPEPASLLQAVKPDEVF